MRAVWSGERVHFLPLAAEQGRWNERLLLYGAVLHLTDGRQAAHAKQGSATKTTGLSPVVEQSSQHANLAPVVPKYCEGIGNCGQAAATAICFTEALCFLRSLSPIAPM